MASVSDLAECQAAEQEAADVSQKSNRAAASDSVGRYTASQVCQLLRVTADELAAWLRDGAIQGLGECSVVDHRFSERDIDALKEFHLDLMDANVGDWAKALKGATISERQAFVQSQMSAPAFILE